MDKAYGAWCDGSHDDSDAWLRARDAVVKTGGELINPALSRLRRTVQFPPPPSGDGERAVYVRGRGAGPSQVLWLPQTKSDNCFVWGDGISHYYYGGASSLAVRSLDAAASGKMIWFQQVIRTTLTDVDISEAHAGDGFVCNTNQPQNVSLTNVEIRLCNRGAVLGDVTGGFGQIDCHGLRLSNNHTRNLVITRGGGFSWTGGMLQGGDSSICAEIGTAANVGGMTIRGVYVETACPTIWRLGVGDGFVTQSTINRCPWTARAGIGQCYVDARNNSRDLEIGGTDANGDVILLRSHNNASGRVKCAPPSADKYDIQSGSWVLEGIGPPAEQPVIARARWV